LRRVLSVYLLNWQNTVFDVGRSMFNVRCSFFLVNLWYETSQKKRHPEE
jgi:hypothetical protein